jgi:hypothetical protein
MNSAADAGLMLILFAPIAAVVFAAVVAVVVVLRVLSK